MCTTTTGSKSKERNTIKVFNTYKNAKDYYSVSSRVAGTETSWVRIMMTELGAAIVDDILAITALSVVVITTMVQTGNLTPAIADVIFLILKILGIFVALLIATVFIVPKVLLMLSEYGKEIKRQC